MANRIDCCTVMRRGRWPEDSPEMRAYRSFLAARTFEDGEPLDPAQQEMRRLNQVRKEEESAYQL